MVAVFRLLVNLASDYAKAQLFVELERGTKMRNPEAKSSRDYRELACESLLEQFKIRDLKMFENVNSQFEDYVNNVLVGLCRPFWHNSASAVAVIFSAQATLRPTTKSWTTRTKRD